jgi:hypothetical protein
LFDTLPFLFLLFDCVFLPSELLFQVLLQKSGSCQSVGVIGEAARRGAHRMRLKV